MPPLRSRAAITAGRRRSASTSTRCLPPAPTATCCSSKRTRQPTPTCSRPLTPRHAAARWRSRTATERPRAQARPRTMRTSITRESRSPSVQVTAVTASAIPPRRSTSPRWAGRRSLGPAMLAAGPRRSGPAVAAAVPSSMRSRAGSTTPDALGGPWPTSRVTPIHRAVSPSTTPTTVAAPAASAID